jgi:hypothetical protein
MAGIPKLTWSAGGPRLRSGADVVSSPGDVVIHHRHTTPAGAATAVTAHADGKIASRERQQISDRHDDFSGV